MPEVRIGFLGIAHVHAPTYVRCLRSNPDAVIAGVWDPDIEKARAFSERHGIPFCADPDELLKDNVRAVLVCAENTRHLPLIRMAAEAGVDILCEKPLGVRAEDLRQSLRVCREHNVRLMTAMCNRYIHTFRDMLSSVRGGAIGKPLACFASNKGTMPGGWFTDPELSGGGCIIDHTVHVADLMNVLTGRMPEEVFAAAGFNLFGMRAEDCAAVSMRYPGNFLVTLDASWSRTKYYPYGRDLTLRLIGTKGNLCGDYFAESSRLYAADERIYHYYGEDKDQMMLDDLVASYLGGTPFPITGEDGCRCALIAEAALRSSKSGRPECPEKLFDNDII